ncbi:MAG: flippase-like domain-containing protein [Myxococcaceae bacterium]|nr:flippase-like domain-containing protein [Myxococcaceae bacterium]
MKKLQALAQSPLGRLLAVGIGLGVVALMVRQSGPENVWVAVTRVPSMFLVVFVLELGVLVTDAVGALLIYGPDRKKIPMREVVRTCMVVYSLSGVLPFGRAAGEAARAAMFARFVGVPLATATAARIQALSLLGNAVISIPSAMAVVAVSGVASWLLLGVGAHFVVAGAMGAGLILAGRRSMLGSRLGRVFHKGEAWGAEVDGHLGSNENIVAPLAWITLSRFFRVMQRGALLIAVGAAFGVVPSFVSEAVNLVSSAVGDAIPLQVGVTEAAYGYASQTLGITKSDGVAMALIVHVAQIVCVGLGFLSPLLTPAVVSEPEAR